MRKLSIKLFMIFIIFLIFIFNITISSLASDNNVIYFHQNDLNKDIQVTIPDVCTTDYKYYLLSSRKTGDYLWTFFAYSNSPFYVNDDMIYCKSDFYFYSLREYETYSTKHDFSSVEFTHVKIQEKTGLAGGMITSFNGSCIVSASYSVYKYDIDNNICSDDEVVFQGAPQEEETQVEQTMIATQITSVDFSQVITELLALLPILLVVLIGLLGLRKAIQLLLQTLRRS